MESALYCGTVTHSRRRPREYQFTYSVFFVYLDLLELARHRGRFPRWPLFGCRKRVPALAWLRRQDHMKQRDDATGTGAERATGDYGGRVSEPALLDDAVRRFVQRKTGGERPRGPVRLLTHLAYAGIGFNPVSFYYVFDEAGERVEYVVAEINNIPWFEQHSYLLERQRPGGGGSGDNGGGGSDVEDVARGASASRNADRVACASSSSSASSSSASSSSEEDFGIKERRTPPPPPPRSTKLSTSLPTCALTNGGDGDGFFIPFAEHAKAFHVSPFIGMQGIRYKWLFSHPGGAAMRAFVELHDDTDSGGGKFFGASLSLKRSPLSALNLTLCMLLYPLLTLKVMLAIHYEAAKLYLRGFPFYPHPNGTASVSSRVIAALAAVVMPLIRLVMRVLRGRPRQPRGAAR